MKKADIIDGVYERVDGLTKLEAAELVGVVFEALKEGLLTHDKVMISGFGNFVVHDKAARMMKNPLTGVQVEVAAHRSVTFKPSPVVKREMNT